jgi:hypothetical protein
MSAGGNVSEGLSQIEAGIAHFMCKDGRANLLALSILVKNGVKMTGCPLGNQIPWDEKYGLMGKIDIKNIVCPEIRTRFLEGISSDAKMDNWLTTIRVIEGAL